MDTRICCRCKIEKPIEQFYKHKQKKGGHLYSCKECEKQRDIKRHAKYKHTTKTKIQEKLCTVCHQLLKAECFYRSSWQLTGLTSSCKSCLRDKHLKQYYKTSTENVKLVYQQQNCCCAICLVSLPMKLLCVDHDHKTGQTRGLLCRPCNSAYGLLKESKQIILNMLSYREKWQNINEDI